MFETIWNNLLFQPMFNVLIWLYENWAHSNLGWAVVYLTIGLRVLLLPLTIINEKNKLKNLELVDEMKRIDKEFHDDPVLKKQEARRILKHRKMSPWAKVASLGVQALVLVLLYQVFLRGITGEKLIKFLYDWVDFPGSINIMFFGFDLGATRDTIWAGGVGLFLLIEIYWDYRKQKDNIMLTKRDLAYFIFFPLVSFMILWLLPMVKSLFVLTSLTFSVIIGWFMKLSSKPKKS